MLGFGLIRRVDQGKYGDIAPRLCLLRNIDKRMLL